MIYTSILEQDGFHEKIFGYVHGIIIRKNGLWGEAIFIL
ncbi:MAG: hypothetical protein RLZZ546_2589 [Bacteroidota bacterium]|jgi:hypothetical protein